MKFLKYLLLVCLFCLPLALHAEVVNQIIALVDNEIITRSDFNKALKENPHPKTISSQQFLDELINEKVLTRELDSAGINIPPSELSKTIEDIMKQQGKTTEQFNADLAKKGLTPQQFHDQVQLQMKKNQFLQKTIIPKIQTSDNELDEYYRSHAQEFQGFGKIRFFEMVITPESAPAGQTPTEFAQKIAARLKAGENFQTLAKQYSRGGFQSQGGDSGLMDTTSLRPDLLNYLLTLKPNVVSEPMPSSGAVFLFKVVEKQNPLTRPFMEVKEMIRQKVMETKLADALDAYLMEARGRHFVEVKNIP